uniref:ARID domain-containing protein n=1 Tax=Steinernema glaseri TaxID=37863 RepID=A0A1I7ZLA2_9BILA
MQAGAVGVRRLLMYLFTERSFKPPFAIDADTFEFTPRDQRLNEIDATAKARMVFSERHSRFWEMQGTPFVVPHIEKRNLDIFGLYKAVEMLGNVNTITKEKKWGQVAKLLGYTMAQGNALKNVYVKWVEPYLRLSHKVNVKKEFYEPNPTEGELRPTVGTSRMMAGLKPHTETIDEPLFRRDIDEMMCDK